MGWLKWSVEPHEWGIITFVVIILVILFVPALRKEFKEYLKH